MNANTTRPSLASACRFASAIFITFAAVAINVDAPATTIISNGLPNILTGPIDDIEVRNSAGGSPTLVINPGSMVGFRLNPDGTLFLDPVTNAPVNANTSQSVAIFDNSIVNMSGGETADSVIANDQSVFVVSAGTIRDDVIAAGTSTIFVVSATVTDDLIGRDSANLTVSAGTWDDISASGSAIVSMSGGTADDVSANATSTFNFSGGSMDDMNISGSALVRMSGTSLLRDDAFFRGTSRMEMSAGRITDELDFADNATGMISGGRVDDDILSAGFARTTITNVLLGDSVEGFGDSVTDFNGGSAASVITGDRGVVNVGGGTVRDFISASPSGVVNVTAGSIGPSVAAGLLGTVNLLGGSGDVVTAIAQSGGDLQVDGFSANRLNIQSLAGNVEIDGGAAGYLDVIAEQGGTVDLTGGGLRRGRSRSGLQRGDHDLRSRFPLPGPKPRPLRRPPPVHSRQPFGSAGRRQPLPLHVPPTVHANRERRPDHPGRGARASLDRYRRRLRAGVCAEASVDRETFLVAAICLASQVRPTFVDRPEQDFSARGKWPPATAEEPRSLSRRLAL